MESEVKINLNRCTAEQLCSFDPRLPFNLAHKIVVYRRRKGDFQSIEDVLNVRGVGLKTYRRLKKKVFVSSCESLPSSSNSSKGNDGARRVKRRSTRIRNSLKNRPKLQEKLLDGQHEETNACWRGVTACHQDGLMIFLKGGNKDYSKELDRIQITFTPKRGDREENSSKGSLMQKNEYNICHSCAKRQDGSKANELQCRPTPGEARDTENETNVFIGLNEELDHSLTSCREARDNEIEKSSTEYVTPQRAPQEAHLTSWKNDRFITPPVRSHQFGSMYFTPIDRQTQTDTLNDGFLREDLNHKGERIQTCENDESVIVEKEPAIERCWLEEDQEKPDTPLQHGDENPIDEINRTPELQIPPTVNETNSTSEDNNGHLQTAHQHSSRRRHQHFNREAPRCFRHGHPKRCKCRGNLRKRHRDRRLSENQSCNREEFFQCTIL